MKGKIILQDITNPVEGMQVVLQSLGSPHGINHIHEITKSGIVLKQLPRRSWDISRLKQIAVEYEEKNPEDTAPYYKTFILPLHPDDWKVAIALIGHEAKFKQEVSFTECDKPYCKSIGRISCSNCAYLDLASEIMNPRRIDIGKEDQYKTCGSIETVQGRLLLPTPVRTIEDIPVENWDNIFKEVEESGFSDSAANVRYWLKQYYHAPKKKQS